LPSIAERVTGNGFRANLRFVEADILMKDLMLNPSPQIRRGSLDLANYD